MNKLKFGDLILQTHESFAVVRGDLFPGGIKSKCLHSMLRDINEEEIVYAAHLYGHSGFALGLAALYYNKRVTLFFAGTEKITYILGQTKSLNNVRCIFVDDCKHQFEVIERAKRHAHDRSAYYMPVGFDCERFNDELIKEARSLCGDPDEVWTPAGSGTTARCLRQAWPKTKLRVVNLRMMPDLAVEADSVFAVPEAPTEEAEIRTPYPSAIYYDAKIWRFAKQFATSGALIWNIA